MTFLMLKETERLDRQTLVL